MDGYSLQVRVIKERSREHPHLALENAMSRNNGNKDLKSKNKKPEDNGS